MQHLITSGGYIAVFLLMVAGSACIPIPSEVVMLFGGALAATGKLSLALVIILGLIGNMVGSFVAWAIGWAGGRPAVERWGRLVWLRPHDLDRAEAWFVKRGPATVFFGRMVPVVRTFISLPAGLAKMEPLRFGLYTFAGSVPWTAGLGAAGYAIGAHWSAVAHGFKDVTYVIAVLAVAAVLAAVAAGWRRWRRERTSADRAAAADRAQLAQEATAPRD